MNLKMKFKNLMKLAPDDDAGGAGPGASSAASAASAAPAASSPASGGPGTGSEASNKPASVDSRAFANAVLGIKPGEKGAPASKESAGDQAKPGEAAKSKIEDGGKQPTGDLPFKDFLSKWDGKFTVDTKDGKKLEVVVKNENHLKQLVTQGLRAPDMQKQFEAKLESITAPYSKLREVIGKSQESANALFALTNIPGAGEAFDMLVKHWEKEGKVNLDAIRDKLNTDKTADENKQLKDQLNQRGSEEQRSKDIQFMKGQRDEVSKLNGNKPVSDKLWRMLCGNALQEVQAGNAGYTVLDAFNDWKSEVDPLIESQKPALATAEAQRLNEEHQRASRAAGPTTLPTTAKATDRPTPVSSSALMEAVLNGASAKR